MAKTGTLVKARATMRGRSDRLGLGLARLRKKRGWSQAELAEAAGLQQGQISKLENGQMPFNDQRLRQLSPALDFDGPSELEVALEEAAEPEPTGDEVPKPAPIDLGEAAAMIEEWCRRNAFDPACVLASGAVAFILATQPERVAMGKSLDDWIRSGDEMPPPIKVPDWSRKPALEPDDDD